MKINIGVIVVNWFRLRMWEMVKLVCMIDSKTHIFFHTNRNDKYSSNWPILLLINIYNCGKIKSTNNGDSETRQLIPEFFVLFCFYAQ